MFPTKDEDFDVGFFQKCLVGFPKIKSFRIEMPATHGVMSSTRKLELEYDLSDTTSKKHDFPTSMILKYGGSEMLSRMKNLLYGGMLYRTEYNFYNFFHHVKPNLRPEICKIPGVYYLSLEPDTGEFIFLMEDLAPQLKKQKENKMWKKCSVAEIREIIKEAAKIHRLFWHPNPGQKRKFLSYLKGNDDTFLKRQGLDWMMEQFQYIFHTQLFAEFCEEKKDSWGVYSDQNVEVLTTQILKLLEQWKPTIEEHVLKDCDEEIREKYKDAFLERDWKKIFLEAFHKMTIEDDLALVHGDFRPDNISLEKDGSVVGIFDWQGVYSGNALMDIACLLMSGLKWEEIRDHEEELLKLYCSELKLKDVTLEKIKGMYRRALAYEMMKAIYWTGGAHKYKDQENYGTAYKGLVRLLQSCIVSVLQNY